MLNKKAELDTRFFCGFTRLVEGGQPNLMVKKTILDPLEASGVSA